MEPTRNVREPRVVISAWSAIAVMTLLLAPLDASAQSPCNDDGVCDPGETVCECPLDDCPDVCGDGCCSGAEDSCDCAADCGDVCGDGCCTGAETVADCEDCVCNEDGVCDPSENICSCPADACPDVCGDGCCTGAEDEEGCPEDCEAAGGDPCDPDSGAPVYFEETFGRQHGKPVTEVRDFDGDLVDGTVCLDVSRVASATLDLNDERVFRQSDFNNNVTELSRAVSVQEANSLVVRLTGRPTGTMHVRVVEGVAETPDGGMPDGAMDGGADGGETTGGAGCSVGGGSTAGGGWLLLFALGMLPGRRRRARTAR